MEKEFDGRVAVVTGASSGIGRATTLALAAAGARVVAFSRNAEALHRVAKESDAITPITGDVADEHHIERLFAATERDLGACDLLVNNAGMIDPKLITATSTADWDRLFAVNVRGAFLATRRALPNMLRRKSGVIVNVASISGVIGQPKFPGFASYCASKAAVIAFTESTAVEVRDHGVRVNSISPGSVDTPMLKRASADLRPDLSAGEIAAMILFLLSDRSRPMNGQDLHAFST